MQINSVMNKKVTSVEIWHIKRIIRSNMNNFITINWGNFIEMDIFLERFRLPKRTQVEIDNLNSPISSKNFITENFPNKKTLGSDGFTSKFY